jgi:predicted dehydrogenase
MTAKKFTKQTIGIGLAGTGFIGAAHLEALRRLGINVIGLAEATAELAAQKAADLGIPKAYNLFNASLALYFCWRFQPAAGFSHLC